MAGRPLSPATQPRDAQQAGTRCEPRVLMMLPEPRLRMLLKLPFATATFSRPDWAVLPYPTWVKLLLLPPWWHTQRVSRLGSSSALLELQVVHGHGRYIGHGASFGSDLPQPGRSGSPAFAGGRASGTARHPGGAGPEASVRSSAYELFGYHRTVFITRE